MIKGRFRAFFSCLPARNTGMILRGTFIRLSFLGSYPWKAARSERLNVPKSEIVTFFPSSRASDIMSVRVSMYSAARTLGMLALCASFSVRSFLLIPDALYFFEALMFSSMWMVKNVDSKSKISNAAGRP